MPCGSIDDVNGILCVDKDEGWTSHDAVAKARRVLGTRKVGHAGTLDPMATGLLTLGAGPSTRLLTHMVGLDKTYTATIRLGESTVSDDRMSEVNESAAPEVVAGVTETRIRSEIARLTGEIEQVPSAVSAIKVDGKRAYDRVRSGETVELKSRRVTIHAFDLHEVRESVGDSGAAVLDLDVTVHCSSGTYIRALARDLGAALGVGGHLVALRRTAVGPFHLADHVPASSEGAGLVGTGVTTTGTQVKAVTTSELAQGKGADLVVAPTVIARQLFHVLDLTETQAIDLANGKQLEVEHDDAELVAAIGPEERLVGLISVKSGRTRVVTNFPVTQTAQ